MFPFVIIQQHFKEHTFCVPSQARIDLQGYTVLWYSMGAQDHPLFLMSHSRVMPSLWSLFYQVSLLSCDLRFLP